jgi:hypothetical protein
VIDKGTFSSGLADAMTLKQSKLVRIVGEPAGGATEGWGNVVPFTLPGSGLSGQYSTQYIRGPGYLTAEPSLQPDIPIGIRSTDFFARQDPVMDAILGRTEGVPPTSSGPPVAEMRNWDDSAAVTAFFGNIAAEVLTSVPAPGYPRFGRSTTREGPPQFGQFR